MEKGLGAGSCGRQGDRRATPARSAIRRTSSAEPRLSISVVTPVPSQAWTVSLTSAAVPMMCMSSTSSSGISAVAASRSPARNSSWTSTRDRLVAHPVEDRLVEVLVLGAHAAHVEGDDRLHAVDDRLLLVRVGDDLDVAGGRDLEVGPGTTGALAGEALVEPRAVHRRGLRRVEDRDPAVGDLGGLGDVLGPLRAEPDRDVGAQRVHDRLERLAEADRALAGERQRVVRAGVGDRALASQHLADDVDDLAGAGQRLAERRAVPALDHLRPAHSHAQDDPAVARGGPASARASRSTSASGLTSARSRCRA